MENENELIKCYDCKKEIPESEAEDGDGQRVCNKCHNSDSYFSCSNCGEKKHKGNKRNCNNCENEFCDNCLDNNGFTCSEHEDDFCSRHCEAQHFENNHSEDNEENLPTRPYSSEYKKNALFEAGEIINSPRRFGVEIERSEEHT